ncbi:MAG: universal stress protein, partial [Rhodoglobus sp.]
MGGRVVVGVDGSGPSRAALVWAKERAVSMRVPILALHVVEDEAERPAGEEIIETAVESLRASAP